jgi:hypothetical protein
MNGTVPESIGQLLLLENLWIGWEGGTNLFVGPLPTTMSNLVLLEVLYLNAATLSGPLPDLSRLTRLYECRFTPSGLCRDPQFIPKNSRCNFSVLPWCGDPVPDCVILAEWLPMLFDEYSCCQADGVTCEEDRIVILDLSKTKTGKYIYGGIPTDIGGWDQLKELYLQDNILEGNFPISLANISSLKIVNITNNYLSGVLPFVPSFELIGIETNLELSLPYVKSTASVKETQLVENSSTESSSVSNTTVGLIGATVFLVVSFACSVGIYMFVRRAKSRREDNSYTPSDDWSDCIPLSSVSESEMYVSDDRRPKDANGLIFTCLISTGGFGQVWKVLRIILTFRESMRARQLQ